jgi:hypothetical protein
VVGSKFPGEHLWPRPLIPTEIIQKTILIIRNPYSCVLSSVRKINREGGKVTPRDVHDILFQWISAWNYLVKNHSDGLHLCFFYESFEYDQLKLEQTAAEFLGIPCDFEFSKISPNTLSHNEIVDLYHQEGISFILPFITPLFDYENWLSAAKSRLQQNCSCGYVFPLGKTVSFTVEGEGLRYLFDGYYEPENDGTWSQGHCLKLRLTPEKPLQGAVIISFVLTWVMSASDDEPIVFTLSLGGRLLDVYAVAGGNSAAEKRFKTKINNFVAAEYVSSTLEFNIENPRNPMLLGLSGDNRMLGIMIKSIRIDCDGIAIDA